ncbi:hypothetical protein PV04_00235 [Phialophora macrospora]|uniref:Uncharacterized protein n=1 Tax=Phialophora macrospora TaxID=1851006 RepID=A0A0D2D3H1_9EURO|nr:hypothetical protein PV04_00235 [Phialophora macrospora]
MSYVYTGIWKENIPEGTRHHLTVSDSNAFVVLTVVALMIEFAVMSLWLEHYPLLRRSLPQRLQNLDELKRADGVTPSVVLVSLVRFFWRERHVGDDWWRSILLGMWTATFVIAALGIPIAAAWGLTYGTMETPTVKASGSTCSMVIGMSRSQTTLRNINLTLAASEYFQSCYLRHTPPGLGRYQHQLSFRGGNLCRDGQHHQR